MNEVRRHTPPYPFLAEEDLVALAGEGDASAFAALYDRHVRAAHSLAYRMMGERRAAEDLSQDAFLPIHSHPSSPAAVER